jgi:hypothetical protein
LVLLIFDNDCVIIKFPPEKSFSLSFIEPKCDPLKVSDPINITEKALPAAVGLDGRGDVELRGLWEGD